MRAFRQADASFLDTRLERGGRRRREMPSFPFVEFPPHVNGRAVLFTLKNEVATGSSDSSLVKSHDLTPYHLAFLKSAHLSLEPRDVTCRSMHLFQESNTGIDVARSAQVQRQNTSTHVLFREVRALTR